jgi:hypothetical protein
MIPAMTSELLAYGAERRAEIPMMASELTGHAEVREDI